MTHTYPIPNTSAAIQAARDALDAIEPAVQQDIRNIVARHIEAGDIPAARRAVIEAAATASSASDVDNIVVAQEQIRVAAAQPTPAPALAAEPRPAVVRETVVVHDDPTPDVTPAAAPAATQVADDKFEQILSLLQGEDGLVKRSALHHGELFTPEGTSRIGRLEDAVFDSNGNALNYVETKPELRKAIVVLAVIWIIGYIITGVIFGWFSWPAWVIVPVIALIASAVTLVISNGHRRTTHNHDA